MTVERSGQRLAVRLVVPPAGFVMYEAAPGLRHLSASGRAEAAGIVDLART